MLYASSNVVAAVIPNFFKGRSCFALKYKPMQPRQPLNSPNSFIISFIIFVFFYLLSVYVCKDSRYISNKQIKTQIYIKLKHYLT